MRKGFILTLCLVGSLDISAAFSREPPPIAKGSEIGVAATSMAIAMVCDLRYGRPELVQNSKALFLKFAHQKFDDPDAATARAFRGVRQRTTRAEALAASHQTIEKCDQLGRMLRRELGR